MKNKKLTLAEVGRQIGMCAGSVRRRIDQGRIVAEIDSDTGYLVVDPAEVERYLADRWKPYTPSHATSNTAQKP